MEGNVRQRLVAGMGWKCCGGELWEVENPCQSFEPSSGGRVKDLTLRRRARQEEECLDDSRDGRSCM